MVTVEAAVALGSLAAVLVIVLAATAAMVTQIRCVDAAAEAARLASRGDDDGARRAAARLLPAGTEVAVEAAGDDVRVRVRAPPLGSALPGLRIGAESVAAREPDVAGPAPGGDAPPDLGPTGTAGPDPGSPGPTAPPAGSSTDPSSTTVPEPLDPSPATAPTGGPP